MEPVWSARAKRFRDTDTGRWISTESVRDWMDTSILHGERTAESWAEAVAADWMTPSQFNLAMRQELKEAYIRQYVVGRGGREQMTSSDWGRVGGMLRDQYRHLDAFVDDMGTLSEGQIASRARMYINSQREAFERSNSAVQLDAGKTQELWVLGAAEHCDDCVALAAMGWTEIGGHGTVPGAGDTACLTNCQCHLEYRK
jgi:hypothetical protein